MKETRAVALTIGKRTAYPVGSGWDAPRRMASIARSVMPMPEESSRRIKHRVECDGCDSYTYMFERYCHRCGNDRWSE